MAEGLDGEELARRWHNVMSDYARISCALDRTLGAEHDLSSSEFNVLEQLCNADRGVLRMSELAARVHLSQSALSRLVTRLEKDGLLARHICDNDRRSVFTMITADGGKRYDAARSTHRAVLRDEAALCGVQSYVCSSELAETT